MPESDGCDRYAVDLAYQHDLTLPQGRQLAALAIHALDPSHEPGCLAYLADPAVADAYVTSPLGAYATDESVDGVDRLAVGAIAGGHDTAGAWYLRACVADHRGDIDVMREHLASSLERDAGFGPSLGALGFLAFVAGDARGATRLLGASDDRHKATMLHTLGHHPPRRDPVGRNEPCRCGSGRKHKHCCVDANQYSLDERVWWLLDKVRVWMHRLPQHGDLLRLACAVAGVEHEWDDPAAVDDAIGMSVLDSYLLLEGGLLQRFLDRLGPLLPDDERQLATSWLTERHKVWEVCRTNPGWSLELESLLDGTVVEADNGRVSRCTQPGEVVYAAVLPRPSGGWVLPYHPMGLDVDEGHGLAELLAADIDPFLVLTSVFRSARSATM